MNLIVGVVEKATSAFMNVAKEKNLHFRPLILGGNWPIVIHFC
jgi:hypothetical protein